ncbi:condensation domain-containing protein [Pseudomonas anguilliseptica]|uniref:condensation domain-containing protein n=1 Tax=Pseudomonas anguilliseptica TaxID=53406 RepID=UPI0022AE9BFC|nr:condensation domain-containing protein [Pseudomonas anguilliseptica]MCZ4324351.1 condensation domain-containing protein [Pseudomonas anguilliseptica]
MLKNQGRPLGQIETNMALMHELNGSTQTASLLSFAGPLSASTLLHAAEKLHWRHPLLHSRIVERAGALHFKCDVSFAQIKVHNHPLLSGQTPAQMLQNQLDSVLDPQRQLWRVLLLSTADRSQHHLLLTCHHAIADAISLTQLLGELLSLCESQQIGGPSQVQQAPLAAALETYLTPETAPQPPCENPAPVRFLQSMPLARRRTGIRRLLLDSKISSKLKHLAKAQGLTLNSLLAAALLKASGELALGSQIRISTAVSLRQRAATPIDKSAIGCFIGVANHCLPVTARSLGSIAIDYQRQLQASLPHLVKCLPAQELDSMRTRIHSLRSHQSFVHGIALTNHGVIEFPQYRHFKLLDYANAASRVAGNFAVALHVTGFATALSLCFTFPDPLMDETRIRQLQNKLHQALLDFISASEVDQ